MQQKISSVLFCFFVLIAACSFSFTGCGKKYPGSEALHPVTITVVDAGNPVVAAVVILDRENGIKVNASGLTDAAGKATILIDAEWKGVPEGVYQVRIVKEPEFTPDLSNEEYTKLEPDAQTEYDRKMLVKRNSLPPVVSPVLSGNQSPLKITVSPGANEETYNIAEYPL